MPKKSSKRWLKEHFSDPYVKKAKQAGLRSRAVFKIQELQERDKLFAPGMIVIDIGASPGGWSQYVSKCVGRKGKLIAVDILTMAPIPDVDFIQGDFSEEKTQEELKNRLNNQKVDWIIADIAPNLSGIDSVDQARSISLAESVLEFALSVLGVSGGLLIKVFQGSGFEEFLSEIKRHFQKVTIRKPKASRGRSREVYILAKKASL